MGEFDVIIDNNFNGKITAFIFNVLGEEISCINFNNNISKFHFDLSDKPKGVYTVKLKTSEDTYYKRVVIQ